MSHVEWCMNPRTWEIYEIACDMAHWASTLCPDWGRFVEKLPHKPYFEYSAE